ncbi:hypothetical protein AVEN_254249-1 [Araneus ventricosus]|uniref:Uncharacterized protein n=1 Tax=Araneus ventricosus TaxID=182803 RepID=A0A4Y2LWS9_ARAVE|nr:hypothetical protein AVEN_254249-1 [Araneus ventricosus]
MLSDGATLLHDNIHTARKTQEWLRKFKWEVWSPDSAPNLDSKHLSGTRFSSESDVKTVAEDWLNGQDLLTPTSLPAGLLPSQHPEADRLQVPARGEVPGDPTQQKPLPVLQVPEMSTSRHVQGLTKFRQQMALCIQTANYWKTHGNDLTMFSKCPPSSTTTCLSRSTKLAATFCNVFIGIVHIHYRRAAPCWQLWWDFFGALHPSNGHTRRNRMD